MIKFPATALSFLAAAMASDVSRGAILANPSVTASATPFNPTYAASKLFDSDRATEYASLGQGANTFVDMDFGSPVTVDRMFIITRLNNVDVVGQAQLVLSNNADFSSPLGTFNFNPSGQNGQGFIQSFTPTTARYARWDVITSTGGSQNLGGGELRFLNTAIGSVIVPATVIGGGTPFGAGYALSNAANNDAGWGGGSNSEYASASLGANMYVDFDLGSQKQINGFDFFDRLAAVDRTTQFDLVFSNASDFSSIVSTQSYSTGAGWGYSQTFAPVSARYVRFDATATAGPTNASGMQEMIFYAVPEPSAALLSLGSAILLTGLRRRRGQR